MLRKIASLILGLAALIGVSGSAVFAQGVRINPVAWKTNYNKITSSDFHIRIGQKYFYGTDPLSVSSDPGVSTSTLELTWQENNQEMRMFMYFKKTDATGWQMYDLRTYNAFGNDWIYYVPDVSGNINQTTSLGDKTFIPKDGSDAEIYCKNCAITAFMSPKVPLSSEGFGLDFRIGLSGNETITLSTDPMSGYGVNALLVDSGYQVVRDQSGYSYMWHALDPNIVAITPGSVPYPDNKCAYDILAPCPNFNLQIQGRNPGVTQVMLEVIRNSDSQIIASNSFDVKVVDANAAPIPPVPTGSQDDQQIRVELSKLRGEVGEIHNQVQQQGVQLGLLQQIILGIQEFLNRLFGMR